MKNIVGHAVSDANVRKVASLAHRLSRLQPSEHSAAMFSDGLANGSSNDFEFGADLVFQAPARFLVDDSLEHAELMGDESTATSSFHEGWYDNTDAINYNSAAEGRNFNLSWLRDACDQIVRQSISQLSRDDLAMAICRVLDSDKPGEEVLAENHSSQNSIGASREHILR